MFLAAQAFYSCGVLNTPRCFKLCCESASSVGDCKFPENFSLPDWSYVIAGLDPAISPAKGIPASERGNDIVSYKSKLGLSIMLHTYPLLKRPRNGPCHSETGEESMVSFRLCMKEDFQNKNMSFSPTWAEAPLCDYLPV